jgi:ribosomal protein S18 acetylase RimI-like enzyme
MCVSPQDWFSDLAASSQLFMAQRNNEEDSARRLSLRPVSADDSDFLLRVYASTREEETASWGWSAAQIASFVQMQFIAKQRGYAAAYPSAEKSVIFVGDVPAGSMVVFRGSSETRLVDIAFLPEFRSRGFGGHLIRMLISEAASSRSALRLSVLRGNRAQHLYERLGFVAKGGDEMYCEMECSPAQTQGRPNAANTSLENVSDAGKSE